MISFNFGLQRAIKNMSADHSFEELRWEFLLHTCKDEITPIRVTKIPQCQAELLLFHRFVLICKDIKLRSNHNYWNPEIANFILIIMLTPLLIHSLF